MLNSKIKNNCITTDTCYLKIALFVLLFIVCSIHSFSQAPVISSFSPTSGPVGSTVTINGNYLSAGSTTVYFGADKATIISQNTTQIKVAVPAGANYRLITVTTNFLTAYTEKPFILTFNASGPVTTQTFANKLNFTASPDVGVSGTAVTDLDGDGKNDLIAVITGASRIGILQNTSNSGNLSFGGTVVGLTQGNPECVAADDLDGDGRPDIVVTNFSSNTVTIFLNISAANRIMIRPMMPLQTGANPFGVAIADFDGDGRPDIVVANHYSSPTTISVFRNITSGTGTISFAPRIDLPADYNPRELTTADIDNDGKPDIIVANQGATSVSVFRNTSSTNGSISFAPKFDLVTPQNSNPVANSWPESVATGDFNGDGKLDIAVADNNSPGFISIFANNSTSGNLAFSTRQDFSTGNNSYSIATGDLNGDGKPDIAVSNEVDNTVSVLVNSGSGGAISFNPHIDYATGNYPRSANIADENGDGKPDIVTGNNNENTVSVLLSNFTTALSPSIITFPLLHTSDIDANNNIKPGATSTNPETPITYTSSNPAVAIITPDGLIHLLAPGVTVITASQAGDANYSAATPVSQTLTVTESQVITFPPISVKSTCDADFPAGAVSTNNTIPLTYTSSNTAVATISALGVIHITGAGATTITVSQDGNSLYTPADPQSQILNVNPPVTPIVSIAADPTSICDGMTVTYTATVSNMTGNLTYQWQLNGLNTGSNSSTFANNHIASTDVVKCTVTNNSSCPTTGTSNNITGILVDQYVTPSILIASTTTGPVCSGTAVSFTADPTTGGTSPTYQWQVNGVNAGTNSPSFASSSLNNGDLVTCLLTNNGGACLTTSTVVSNGIMVSIRPPDNPAPSVTIAASANGIYAGVPVKFTATPVNASGTPDYQWLVNGSDVGTDSPVFESSTLNNGDQVTCEMSIKNSCNPSVSSQPVLMNILQPVAIRIPNAFTPNGDGINDRWDIPDLAYYPNCILNIYTRYGSMIYQSRGYTTGWDGLYKGKVLPTGTYYYIIDLGNNSPKLSGYVALIK